MIEIRQNDDGSLDEIVASNCSFHLEQLDDNEWWMVIYESDEDKYGVHVNIYGKEVRVFVEDQRRTGA